MSAKTFETFGFELRYRCRVLDADQAPTTRRVVPFFQEGPWTPETGIAIEVVGEDCESWTGKLAGGPEDYKLTGAFAAPSPIHLFAVAHGEGIAVHACQAESWQSLPVMPVLAILRVPGREIVVMHDFQDMAAFGPHGLLWVIDRLALDDLQIKTVGTREITGVAYDPKQGGSVRFAIDPVSGETTGGSSFKQLRVPPYRRGRTVWSHDSWGST
jgi:hypothetical protein